MKLWGNIMELKEIREKIDCIDDKIVQLFVDRMNLAGEVAKNKIETGKMVSDSTREDEIIYRLASKTPDELKYYIKELYSTMFAVSKSLQNKIVNTNSETVEQIKNALNIDDKSFPVSATVACQGVNGANSGVAAKRVFPISEISYFKTFEGVFSAVDKGLCEFGILPIENSTAGSVLEVYDLMNRYNFYITKAIRVKINHCLAVIPGADKKDIKKVYSHNQALKQCVEYIKTQKFEGIEVENTAVAAKSVLEGQDKTVAAICSKECASIYGLKIIDENIEDNSSNFTRFIVISKKLNIYKGNDKISIMTSASHEVGSLSKLLLRFSALGLNLSKIESRPIVGSDFEFLFYFDFDGNIEDAGVLNLIAEMENGSIRFKFLGSYKEII